MTDRQFQSDPPPSAPPAPSAPPTNPPPYAPGYPQPTMQVVPVMYPPNIFGTPFVNTAAYNCQFSSDPNCYTRSMGLPDLHKFVQMSAQTYYITLIIISTICIIIMIEYGARSILNRGPMIFLAIIIGILTVYHKFGGYVPTAAGLAVNNMNNNRRFGYRDGFYFGHGEEKKRIV